MKLLISLCFVLVAVHETTSKCPERAFHPVCASDNQVYANPCSAKEKCLKIVDWDQCSCDRPCTKEYDPVCGSDGVIYSNRCILLTAACNAKGDVYEVPKERCCNCENCDKSSQCEGFCNQKLDDDDKNECASKCDKESKPVCHDGLNYDNQCLLDCEKPSNDGEVDETANQKPCDDDCPDVCPLYYDPVCGGYGNKYQIYSNKCFLGIAACHDKRIHEVDNKYCNTQCPKYGE